MYANRTDPRTETSQWITPKKHALRLKAKSSRTLTFHLQVPDDATPGDHVGAVAFQRILSPKKEGEFAVRQVLRVAVAVQIRVEGTASAKLELGGITISALGGTQIPSVNVELKNTGQLLCRPTLNVTLAKGDEGLGTMTVSSTPSSPATRSSTRCLAEAARRRHLRRHGRDEWLRPRRTDQGERRGAGRPAREPAGAGPDTAALEDDKGGIPWWALVLAVGGALGLGFLLARRTGRNDEPRVDAAAPAPAAPPAPAAVEPPPTKAVAIEPEPDPAPPADDGPPADRS